jgi:hypothetical protein
MTWVNIGVAGGTALLGSITGKKDRKRKRQAEELPAAQEAERRRQIDYATTSIDRAYDSPARQQQYDDFAGALYYDLSKLPQRKGISVYDQLWPMPKFGG